jgi:hypothetical protein
MRKSLALILSAFLLTGCGQSLSPEEEAYKAWSSNVYEYQDKVYESNSDMKREAYYEVKPVLDKLSVALGENKIHVDTSVFNEDGWFKNACLNYKNEIGLPILEPLKEPIIGVKDSVVIHGYVEFNKFESIMKEEKFIVEPRKSDSKILFGSNMDYPYQTKSLAATKETEHFKFVITTDTAWNALLWEGYVLGGDPGNYDTSIAFPDKIYAPISIQIYFKKSCELFLPDFKDLFDF